ncbi:unnamed protein product [Symbiodinium sp. CCMP2592]|nr:unnamed protein product [Symbiodinium sp. CCMP2592]
MAIPMDCLMIRASSTATSVRRQHIGRRVWPDIMHLLHLAIVPDVLGSLLCDLSDLAPKREAALQALYESYRSWCEETGVPDRAAKRLFSSATLHPNSKDYLSISQKLLSGTAARYSVFWMAQLLTHLMKCHPGNEFYALRGGVCIALATMESIFLRSGRILTEDADTLGPCWQFWSTRDQGNEHWRTNCRFAHDWMAIPREERAERCKGCGGKGHMKRSCPMKAAGSEGGKRGDEGKGGQGPKVRSVGAGVQAANDGKRDDGTTSQAPLPSPATSASLGSSMDSAQGSQAATANPATTARDMDEFLKSAAQEEWSKSPEVDVIVAGDSTARMKQNDTGTLLTQPTSSSESTQTILPVGSLVAVLGYELRWCRKKCVLRAPDGKEILLKTSSGCPEVDEAKALELIAEIEQENVNKLEREVQSTKVAMLRANTVECEGQWERGLSQYVKLGTFEEGFRFLAMAPWLQDVPRESLVKVVMDLPKEEKEAWSLMLSLGFNRRMRKRLMQKDWVVKLFSGARSPMDKVFKVVENNSSVVLDVDVRRLSTLDLRSQGDGVMKLLMWGAATGRIAVLLGGLPRAHCDDLLLRSMVLADVAKAGRASMCEYADAEDDETAKVWRHQWFRRWIEEQPLDVLHFEQGGLGHGVRKPTMMVTNLDITELRGVQDQRPNPPETTTAWSAWAPMMVRTIVRGIKRWKQRPGWYPRMMRALKAVDRRAWERHLANDHTPYRADCLQCIHNATGRRRTCWDGTWTLKNPVINYHMMLMIMNLMKALTLNYHKKKSLNYGEYNLKWLSLMIRIWWGFTNSRRTRKRATNPRRIGGSSGNLRES